MNHQIPKNPKEDQHPGNHGNHGHHEEPEDYASSAWGLPAKLIVSLFLIFILVLWIVPNYAIKLDPAPSASPSKEEVIPVFPGGNEVGNESFSSIPDDYFSLVIPSDPYVKFTADKILSLSGCPVSKVCYSKAIFAFVRDEFDYVNDPATFEFIKDPKFALQTTNGDCDDASVLLANLLQAIGVQTRFVFIPRHVYVQAKLPDARSKYKEEGDWVNLDATCTYCGFGEIPYQNVDKTKSYFPR